VPVHTPSPYPTLFRSPGAGQVASPCDRQGQDLHPGLYRTQAGGAVPRAGALRPLSGQPHQDRNPAGTRPYLGLCLLHRLRGAYRGRCCATGIREAARLYRQDPQSGVIPGSGRGPGMKALQDKAVLIVGLGLIGGSVARALREKALCRSILACGRDPAPLRRAQADGVVDEWSTDMAALAAQADIVLIAVPTCTVRRVLQTIRGSLRPDVIVTDAASVKGSVVGDAREVLGERSACFVPAHPIAGSEHSGYAASMADLYAGRKVIVTPLPENPAAAIETVVALWQGI